MDRYSIKYFKDNIKIYSSSETDHRNICQKYKKSGVQFYTYGIRDQKNKKIVIKVAPHINENELTNQLLKQNAAILQCKKLQSKGENNSSLS